MKLSKSFYFRVTSLSLIAVGLCICLDRIGAAPASTQSSPAEVLTYLNETIDWYRHIQSLEQTPGDSQELLLRSAVLDNAKQALQLGFRYARGQAALMKLVSGSPTTSRGSSIAQKAAEAQARADQAQAQLNELDHEIANAAAGSADLLYARLVCMVFDRPASGISPTSQRDVLQEYARFMQVADSDSAASFPQKIDQLEQSVPDLQAPVRQ